MLASNCYFNKHNYILSCEVFFGEFFVIDHGKQIVLITWIIDKRLRLLDMGNGEGSGTVI